jgi:signal transduction histidine kinase/CheY-like chemotaxis protein
VYAVGWSVSESGVHRIRYLETKGTPPWQAGADLAHDPVLGPSMDLARRTGQVALSLPIRLSETGALGSVVFHPVYRVGAPLETLAQRDSAFSGFLFVVLHLHEVFDGLPRSGGQQLHARVTYSEPNVQVYESAEPRVPPKRSAFNEQRVLEIGGARWTLDFGVTAAFLKASQTELVSLTLLAGLAVTVLLVGVTWMETRARAKAEEINARLARADEALRRASRAKDEFLAMVGHELRNPLAAMASAIRALRLDGPMNAVTARRLATIDRQVRRQARLVDDLLDVSRLAASAVELVREPTDLAEVVQRALASVRASDAKEGHRIVFVKPSAPVVVHGDGGRLEQIVVNLLTNAVKYTPGGGLIRIVVTSDREKKEARIGVIDRGVGLDERTIREIFAPFFRGGEIASRTEGLGLGLTIVQRLVTMHDGRIEVTSEGLGRGSRFDVVLPLIEGTPVTPSKSLPALPSSLKVQGVDGERPLSVIVVDDMDDARVMLADLLGLMGLDVREASTGEEGISQILSTHPDLAIVDIGLPDTSGLEVARRLRAEGSRTKLVALTGFGAPEDRERALAAGFDDHLVKPADMNRLTEVIRGIEPDGRTRSSQASAAAP